MEQKILLTPDYMIEKANEIKVEQEVISQNFNDVISFFESILSLPYRSDEITQVFINKCEGYRKHFEKFSVLIDEYINYIEKTCAYCTEPDDKYILEMFNG